jgi:tetratricopeptide (TPR) repeat protein
MRIRFVILVAMLLSWGCGQVGQQDLRERNNRIVARAYEELEAGNHKDAATLFRKALDNYPMLARPHLDLAIILHERRGDYIRAIYHYQRYLELRPESEKAAMIRQQIVFAREALARELGGGGVSRDAWVSDVVTVAPVASPADQERVQVLQERVQEELSHLREALARVEAERDGLLLLVADQERVAVSDRSRMQEFATQMRALEVQVKVLEGERDALLASRHAVAASDGSAAAVSHVLQTVDGVRTYSVRPNDSLGSIAQRIYGDATRWRVIYDANREVLRAPDDVRIGQVLVIPEIREGR